MPILIELLLLLPFFVGNMLLCGTCDILGNGRSSDVNEYVRRLYGHYHRVMMRMISWEEG